MRIYGLMRIHYHIFRMYDLTRMYGIFNSFYLTYGVTPYGYNAVYLTLYGLLWACTT